MIDLRGSYVPLVTPFTDDGDSVSEVRLARLVRHFLALGAEGFVVCTDAGEFTTIGTGERKQVLEIVLREAQGVPVLTNITRMGTLQALDLAQHASRHGARAGVLMPPYYGHFSDQEIENHLSTMSSHAGMPLIVVDADHRVSADVRQRLRDVPNLSFAVPSAGAGTASFTMAGLTVSPLSILSTFCGGSSERLEKLLEQYNVVALCKAALLLDDLEVGPPRRPVLALSPEVRKSLTQLPGS